MATKQLAAQVLVQAKSDTGRLPDNVLDTNGEAALPLVLSGFRELRRAEIQIASGAVDQAFPFTDAVAMFVFSDVPIHVRLKNGETQLQNTRLFAWQGDDATHTVSANADLLISVPGASAANLVILYVEKTS